MNNKIITIGYGKVEKVEVGNNLPLAFFGGPCAIESKDHAFFMAEAIGEICEKLNVPWVYKSCYDKDCRSAADSFHGTGIDEGLQILSDVRDEFGVPVVSDFSDAAWAKATGEVCECESASQAFLGTRRCPQVPDLSFAETQRQPSRMP
jgi:2-dehydro-3-deoxyphosphooctonate aldolase (KDO 8-P synthase)